MATFRRTRIILPIAFVVLPALLGLGIFALVDADTLEGSALGRAFSNRTEPRNPVAVAAEPIFRERDTRLVDLKSRIAATSDPDERLALERDYQDVKLRTELDFLNLQLEHARSTGNAGAAARLESAAAAVERLLERSPRAGVIDDPALVR